MRIFCASTGRCGTLFLSEMFRAMTRVPSFHEPLPWCIGRTLEWINNGNGNGHDWKAEADAEVEKKVAQVKSDTSKDGLYFESSNMFIKAYAERMLDEFRDIACIYLYRNPVEVLISHHKKCTEQEIDWILQPQWRRNRLRTLKEMSFYETVLWQWYEVQERYLSLKPRFKKTYEFDFRKINDINEWSRLFEHFGVEVKAKATMPNLRTNNIPGVTESDLKQITDKWDKPGMPAEEALTKKRKVQAIRAALDAGDKIMAQASVREPVA